MRIEWIIVCGSTEVVDGLLTIRDISDKLFVNLPRQQLPVTTAVKIIGDDQPHDLTLSVHDPNHNELFTVSLRVRILLTPTSPPDKEPYQILPLTLFPNTAEYGTYTVTAAIDGRSESTWFRLLPPPSD